MKNCIIVVSVMLIFGFVATTIVHASDQVYFYHTDPAGTPLAMSDATGTVVWRASYLPFGEETIDQSTISNNKMFVGKEKDSESGLYYFGARYKDPTTGRFVSADSIGPVNPQTGEINQIILHDPQRLNRYAYGLNNPYKFVDPDGEMAWELVSLVIIGIPLLMYGWYKFSTNPEIQRKLTEPMRSQENSSETNKEQGGQNSSGSTVNDKIKDISKNPNNWEKIGEKLDPRQPKDGKSSRELWRNKDTGETLEKHVLDRGGQAPKGHPHFKEPDMKDWN